MEEEATKAIEAEKEEAAAEEQVNCILGCLLLILHVAVVCVHHSKGLLVTSDVLPWGLSTSSLVS